MSFIMRAMTWIPCEGTDTIYWFIDRQWLTYMSPPRHEFCVTLLTPRVTRLAALSCREDASKSYTVQSIYSFMFPRHFLCSLLVGLAPRYNEGGRQRAVMGHVTKPDQLLILSCCQKGFVASHWGSERALWYSWGRKLTAMSSGIQSLLLGFSFSDISQQVRISCQSKRMGLDGKRGMWSADLDDGSIVSLGGDAGGAGQLRSVGSTSPCTLLVLCLSHCTQVMVVFISCCFPTSWSSDLLVFSNSWQLTALYDSCSTPELQWHLECWHPGAKHCNCQHFHVNYKMKMLFFITFPQTNMYSYLHL